jgi:hypothetical protein
VDGEFVKIVARATQFVVQYVSKLSVSLPEAGILLVTLTFGCVARRNQATPVI